MTSTPIENFGFHINDHVREFHNLKQTDQATFTVFDKFMSSPPSNSNGFTSKIVLGQVGKDALIIIYFYVIFIENVYQGKIERGYIQAKNGMCISNFF
jgi:hypothetical protein